jgi:Flp pilus assembly pilin Flp
MSRLLARVLREEASAPVLEYGIVAALIAALLLAAASLSPARQPFPGSAPDLRAAPR